MKPPETAHEPASSSVFAGARDQQSPDLVLPKGLELNRRNKMDGLEFLGRLQPESVPVAFFDPQYRGILDSLSYGNEGALRGRARSALPQMDEPTIAAFMRGLHAALVPSGHLFLWVDKYDLCMGCDWRLDGIGLSLVDMLTWNKARIGMGYRTRRVAEYLLVLQKPPRRAKGVWTDHTIPDVWEEKKQSSGHGHEKPVGLQSKLIAAVSDPGDVVIDPAAGSFSVMESCRLSGRNFLGCDING